MKLKLRNSAMRTAMLMLCTATLTALPVMAQDNTAAPARQGGGGARMLDSMTQQLNLTPDQVTQVKAIMDDSQAKMMAVRQDQSTPQEDRRAKMMAIQQDRQSKIRATLTDDQKTKFDAMAPNMGQRGGGQQ